ncbi:MAG: YHYH protein [Gammaproteobacteria bacterium]|nr:YHYH protein [Gammaproteobacteria bacterium]
MAKSLFTNFHQLYPKTINAFVLSMALSSCGGGSEKSTNAALNDPIKTPDKIQYVDNPDLNETANGMLNAVLTNRNPDCRTYVTDANNGDYGSTGMNDKSNSAVDAPHSPGTDNTSIVEIDLVIVSGGYIQSPSTPDIAGGWNYALVVETTDLELATHCRMRHNMIPNHDLGKNVGTPNEDDVWVTEIDHDDMQLTYLPVHPKLSNPLIADDTDRNPTNFMDYDGILLNGVGIAMDSGFCYNPNHARVNAAGNATGCGDGSVWFEIPAYTLQDPSAEKMAAIFDEYYGHGFEGTYHYHAMTHPLQTNNEATISPAPNGSPLIGFAKDGLPIYGQWFVNTAGDLVKAKSGYTLKNSGINPDVNGFGQSRKPYTDTAPFKEHGTPPTPWDVLNRPADFDFEFTNEPFGLPLGRYIDDWVYNDGNTGNLDECNGATDINGVYGYYITQEYPYGPICTFGIHEPSFGKVPPIRWDDELADPTAIIDEHGGKINGH